MKILFILALSLFVFNAFAKIPDQTIICKASVFPADQKIPQMSLSYVQITLLPEQLKTSAEFSLHEVSYKEKYQAFYPRHVFLPRNELSPWEKEILISEDPVADGVLKLSLQRFEKEANRVAGMSLDVNLEKSFNASYLLDPQRMGSTHWITIPKKIKDETILLSVLCEYR